MVKAYSYLRFSSVAQAEGDSLRRQLKAALDWAADRPEIELDTTTRDLGISAYKGEHRVRGALSSFLDRIRAGKIPKGSYFLVESFDRLSRENETVAINLLTGITLAGVKVVTLTDGHVYDDKSDAMDLMRAIIVMSRAHEENKARGKKLAASWAAKKARARETGEILSRRGPSWTEFNDTSRRFDLIEDRAAIIRRIFKEATEGMGGTAISARLNAEGIKPFVAGSDGWHAGYVLTILKSRSVIGYYQPTFWAKNAGERAVRQHDGEDIAGYYPEVIDRELFERVQGIIARRNKRGGGKGRRGATFPNILLGMGRCETCGGTLVLGNAPNSANVRFYRCYNSSRNQRCENKNRYPLKPIERWIAYSLLEAKMDDVEIDGSARELTGLLDRRSELNRKVALLLDQLEAELPGVPERLRQRQLELVEVEKAIAVAKDAERHSHTLNRTDAFVEALVWLQSLDGLTGDELYRARAKANALLNDVYDYVMPVAKGGGVFLGWGRKVRWVGEDAGGEAMNTGIISLPDDVEICGQNLIDWRGELPPPLEDDGIFYPDPTPQE